jgi:hypothetical protein
MIHQTTGETETRKPTKEAESFARLKAVTNELRLALPQFKTNLCDLNAGRGEFLAGLHDHSTTAALVCDKGAHTSVKMDRQGMVPMEVYRITGDICDLYPVLLDTNWTCDLFAMRLPSGVLWPRSKCEFLAKSEWETVAEVWKGNPDKKQIPAALALWLIAFDRMTERGEGMVLLPKKDVDSFAADFPAFSALSRHIWLVLDISARLFDEDAAVEDEFCAVYFAKAHTMGTMVHSPRIRTLGHLNAACSNAGNRRTAYRQGYSVSGSMLVNKDSALIWDAVRTEWNRRTDPNPRTDYHVWLEPGTDKIKAQITRFDRFAKSVPSQAALLTFNQIMGRTPSELVLQNTTRQTLLSIVKGGVWRIDPDLMAAVDKVLADYETVRSPLVPLPASQRLAWLDEVTTIKCTKDLHHKYRTLFQAGQSYPTRACTVLIERMTQKPNMAGEMENILCNGTEMLLSIEGEDRREYNFLDGRHIKEDIDVTRANSSARVPIDFPLQRLLEHFEIPDVPDVSETKAGEYNRHRENLAKIQEFVTQHVDMKFRFKPFQVDDYSRAACTNGSVFAAQTGLGKSLAAIALPSLQIGINWPLSYIHKSLVPLSPVLIVAPENLHEQLSAEWKRRFGIKSIKLDCQDTYLSLTKGGRERLAPGFYLTSYYQLGLNKMDRLLVPGDCKREFSEVAKLMRQYGVTIDEAKGYSLGNKPVPEGSNPLLEKAIAMCADRYDHFGSGVGDWRNGIKCIFSPSLADLCRDDFDCVVIDEGTRIKGEETKIGIAVRELDPKYRLVLTATPIKNRLKDIFYLLWWAAGGMAEPHPRFPYGQNDQDKFAADHLVCERNLTKEARERKERGVTAATGRRKKPRGKPGVEVCNIHRLWKIIAPTVLRRRKNEIGEDIVGKKKHIIRCPMGVKQHKVYEYHLKGAYLDKNGEDALMAKLQALRCVAACPNGELLQQLPQELEHPSTRLYRSPTDYIPKLAACLTIIEQRMRMQEQCVVFSALHEPLDTLSKRLEEAGIPHDVLDGRKTAKHRGKMSAEFREGLPRAKPVLLAGLKAMAEGNNWPLANNVILLAFDWAWDLFEQGINRCHRLDSIKDVNVWPIICTGTIDRKLESMIDEKGDASELVIDGKLIGEDVQEVNLRDLLKIAEEEFAKAETYPETKLEQEWPALRGKLAEAWSLCKGMRFMTHQEKMVSRANSIPLNELLAKIKRLEAA